MTFLRRKLLLAVTLATTAATLSLGQTPAPVGDARAAQGATAIPDFSGLWTHAALGFESPISGPGPVRNLGRTPSGASNFNQLVGDSTNPILQPWAAEIVKKLGEISLAGKAFPDPDNQCLLNPVPYIFWNFEIQLLQQPDKVTILYPHDQDHRQVRLNQPHPAKVTPSIHGNSVGHYEGDTLVVDTIGMNAKTFVDGYRTPHSEKLHVTERWKTIDNGNRLEVAMTIDDAETFVQPWQAVERYRRVEETLVEQVCAENNQVAIDYHIPVAEKPDF